MQYKGIEYYLETYLNDNIKENAIKMYNANINDIAYWPASVRYHHNEEGGLARHLEEVIYYGLKLYNAFESECKKKLITKSDVVLLGFIHDLEKMTKYVNNNDYDEQVFKPNVYRFKYDYKKIDCHDSAKVVNLCSKFGITLTEKQLNALCYHHGGWTKDQGNMTPLAILLHEADLMSVYFE